MDININQDTEIKYASSFKRTTAISIDITIVMFARIFLAQILGTFWINKNLEKFLNDFNEHFGTQEIKNTPEHIDFIVNNSIFYQVLLFYFIIVLVGFFYHSYLNSSAWQGTIGKRLMGIVITTKNYSKISFANAASHYVLSILPIVYVIYILIIMANKNLTLFAAITSTPLSLFLGFAAILWIQIHSFTKKKTTAYDLICKTFFICKKTSAKFPWSKIN